MYLLIDAGNSRTKFGCHDGQRWLERAAIENRRLAEAATLPAGFQPRRIVIANVGGASAAARLEAWLSPWRERIEWLRGSAQRAGVQCQYDAPERLGADRWAMAIGAWHHFGGPCMVVSAGTATTIDIIDDGGIFRGGCILPGLGMMKAALANGTANLPLAVGTYRPIPSNTEDAIVSGCLNAQLGAIERMARQLPADSPIALSGGAGPAFNASGIAFTELPWLSLDGLLAVARESDRTTGQ
ncbi:MAG: type III pantothenate kinase [Rhodocyclaceae bacterium]